MPHCRDCGRAAAGKGIEQNFARGGGHDAVGQLHRLRGRMRVAPLLRDAPDVPHAVCAGGKCESGLCNEINDFVGRQKITGIEVDAARPLPDDDLPHRHAP
ncbi:hypothetical protein SDC9_146975 [bioreactor metagenome]|uniref:Uncharacterized protein n=1 Tax=bioreactor metagenome TaxID=1076179 RepID=A0A645EES4_9ZZZZ